MGVRDAPVRRPRSRDHAPLWAWGRPALVREMVDDLQKDRQIAYTTVMTVMDNLYRKRWLRRIGTAGP